MLDDNTVTDAARRLLAAERSRQPIRQLSLQYPDMTVEDAYRVQRALVAAKIAEGRTVRARKIGLTSRAMQQAVSITEPDYGVIFDDMVFCRRRHRAVLPGSSARGSRSSWRSLCTSR